MTSNKNLKTLVFSLGLLAMTLTANNLNAQNGGGLFGRGAAASDYSISSSEESLMRLDPTPITGSGIQNDDFGAPLGSGIAILFAAGAGYAVVRRKRSRKNTMLLLACVALLGFTQCKKEQIEPQNQGEQVRITLDVENGNNDGSRVNVDPPHVTFEKDDEILVGYDGKYVGTITHNGTNFTGNISITQNGDQPLYFYFLGNKTPEWTISGSDKVGCTVNISDQTTELPVISMAPSKENYPSSGNTYTAKLHNKASLMSFNVTTSEASKSCVCIEGLNNTVSVNFATPNAIDNGFEYSKSGVGRIMMQGGDGSHTSFKTWAIVLPQNEDLPAAAGKAYINNYEGIRPAIDAFGSNQYLDNEVALNLNTENGKLIGHFSVSDTKKVNFSQGNLRATKNNSVWSWSFAEHQYDCLGNANSNISFNDTVDLFGWNGETSGNDKYGISSSATDSDYGNTAGETLKHDWGHNPITNGGNTADIWRTLTKAEWEYLFNTRSTPSGVRFAAATVNGVDGMILLPDDWNTTYYSLSSTNTVVQNITNIVSLSEWNTKLEAHGAVFLPATTYMRHGDYWAQFPSIAEVYWTSISHETTASNAYVMFIMYGLGDSPSAQSFNRHFGCHVRLVRDVN